MTSFFLTAAHTIPLCECTIVSKSAFLWINPHLNLLPLPGWRLGFLLFRMWVEEGELNSRSHTVTEGAVPPLPPPRPMIASDKVERKIKLSSSGMFMQCVPERKWNQGCCWTYGKRCGASSCASRKAWNDHPSWQSCQCLYWVTHIARSKLQVTTAWLQTGSWAVVFHHC